MRFLVWFTLGGVVALLALFALPVLVIILVGLFLVRALA